MTRALERNEPLNAVAIGKLEGTERHHDVSMLGRWASFRNRWMLAVVGRQLSGLEKKPPVAFAPESAQLAGNVGTLP